MDADVDKSSTKTTVETSTSRNMVGVSNSAFEGILPGHTLESSSTATVGAQSIVITTTAGKTALVGGAVGVEGDEAEVARCGWLCLTPKCLQRCRTAKWVLFWLCWASTIQGMVVNGFINSVITNIEKRFDLRSTDAGVIAGAYDIASVLCAIPVSYLGSRPGASKPRWLGWGIFIMGLGSFCFAAPHFLAPTYNPSGSDGEVSFRKILVCLKDEEYSERCTMNAQDWMSKFRIVFIISQFIHGIGSSPLYTLGTTFLDESVPMKMSSIYLGIFYAMGAVGPALGYVLGSIFLKIYIDAPHVDPAELDISPSSNLWLGGWWIGFLLSGTLSLIISLPIMSFPDKLPGHKTLQASRVSEAYSGVENSASAGFGKMRDFPRSAKTLLANPTFLALSLAGAFEGSLMTGFATFTPKFLETQFQIPASRASVLIGLVAVPAAGGGTFLGGWIVKKLNLGCKGIIRVCIILSSLCFLSYFTFTISCPNNHFAGANVAYDNDRPISIYDSNLTGSCNANCSCTDVPYDPVCGSNGVMYFSPCHAGCTTMNNESKVYSECACVHSMQLPGLQFTNDTSNKGTAMRENLDNCKETCPHMTTFLIVFFIIMLITFVIGLPALTATLRCVPNDQRSLALGLQWIIVRLLGTIPGPMIFGSLIDNTCTLWQNTCGITGSCRMYDNPNMSKYMMGTSLFGKFLSTLLFIVAWKLYVPPSSKIVSSMSCDTMTSTLTYINDTSTLTTINESESKESLESFNKDDIELT